MSTLKFVDTHNMVAFLSKLIESEGFEQIVDFLNANPIRYALMVNPTLYTSCIEQFWAIVKAKTVNGEVHLEALVDGKKIIIIESTMRKDLQLEDDEGVDCLPNATIFKQLILMGGPTKHVADEAVYKERDDSLVRVVTTASSLEADSGGGPRCQETMGDTIAQTRFENESKTSNDSLLVGVNTPRSDEDSLKLKKFMELWRKIDDIDADEGVTLVDETVENQGRFDDEEMFDVDALDGEEVFVATQNENVVEEVVNVVQDTAAETITITSEEITLA
ncbi:hypothetical protein Tco_1211649 [Tanacetum coccineum]